MEKFIDEKLEKMGDAGGFIGQAIRKIFRGTSKGFLVVGILAFCGLVVFIWGIYDGARKKK
jgi:hypothetical protein